MFYKSDAIEFRPFNQGAHSAPVGAYITAISKIWALLGATIVLLYLLRGSLIYLWAGPLRPLMDYGGQVLLLIAAFIFLFVKEHMRVSVTGLYLIAFTFFGILYSDFFDQAFAKWLGWTLLFLVFGPVFHSVQACTLRSCAWSTFKVGFVIFSILSLIWYMLGLPNYWFGSFTGVTTYSMLLSPMAAMAVLICANYAIAKRSGLYAILSALSIAPCFLAGSRTAILALIAGVLVLAGIYFYKAGFGKSARLMGFFILLVLLSGLSFESIKTSRIFSKYTSTLQEKGLQNTRQKLWDARWDEFRSNPLFGIGIGMGMGGEASGVAKDASGKINVEPGSSFLALLSMTGISGAIGVFFVLANLLFVVRRNWSVNSLDLRLSEVLIITVFLFVHMAAEGWIFAVGSPFCLLFWLCLGRFKDLAINKNNQYNNVVTKAC